MAFFGHAGKDNWKNIEHGNIERWIKLNCFVVFIKWIFCCPLQTIGARGLSVVFVANVTFQWSFSSTIYTSDSQSLLRGPLVVREMTWSGPRIPTQIIILCFADHQIITSGPRPRKVWEPLIYTHFWQNRA